MYQTNKYDLSASPRLSLHDNLPLGTKRMLLARTKNLLFVKLLEDVHVLHLRIASSESHETDPPHMVEKNWNASILVESTTGDKLKGRVKFEYDKPWDAQSNGYHAVVNGKGIKGTILRRKGQRTSFLTNQCFA